MFIQLMLAGIIGGIIGSIFAVCSRKLYYWIIDTYFEPAWYEKQVQRKKD